MEASSSRDRSHRLLTRHTTSTWRRLQLPLSHLTQALSSAAHLAPGVIDPSRETKRSLGVGIATRDLSMWSTLGVMSLRSTVSGLRTGLRHRKRALASTPRCPVTSVDPMRLTSRGEAAYSTCNRYQSVPLLSSLRLTPRRSARNPLGHTFRGDAIHPTRIVHQSVQPPCLHVPAFLVCC